MDTMRFLWAPLAPPASGGTDRPANKAPSQVGAAGPGPAAPAIEAAVAMTREQSYMVPGPLRRIWPSSDGDQLMAAENGDGEQSVLRRGNWVMKIMRVRTLWKDRGGGDGENENDDDDGKQEEVVDRCAECGEGCKVYEEEKVEVDKEMFSRMLRRVSLAEAEMYAKMSYLSNLAYNVPKIKSANLLKLYGLQLVTSSFAKRAISDGVLVEEQARSENLGEDLLDDKLEKLDGELDESSGSESDGEREREDGNSISASDAYQIAVSGICYLQSQTMGILPFGSKKLETREGTAEGVSGNEVQCENGSSNMKSFMATTNSVTAVVAGKEEMKQAVVKGLNSAQSSPCEWYICDEVSSGTRYFVIQGSDSLASWQANLLFEPVQFENLDVLVHRGIYEAAKGIYQQMLPEIQEHLESRGNSATLRFTGHSLGGSLALLVNLMLLVRGDAPSSSLLPVITFGAPSIMCGGNHLLEKLGLQENHVQAITMHRDIVPRAFSCNYPDHVARILTAINGKFRNHPCLKNQKMLYAPMGKLLILQPEENFSPHHHLLPSGSGLYHLGHPLADSDDSIKQFNAALFAFLNSPHPLEILSDRSAYGSEGTVHRDHDMHGYLRSVRGVIRQELKLIRKAKRQQRRLLWWPLVSTQGLNSDVATSEYTRLSGSSPQKLSFGGVIHGGKETLKRFRRMVASRHLHMFIVFLIPARALLMGTLSFVSFR